MRIVHEVAEKYGVTIEDLRGRKRAREYSWPRQIAMLRLVDETTLSYPAIARILRRECHTTIIYGERAARQRIKEGLQP
jgi:chromosomal replication initiator protein